MIRTLWFSNRWRVLPISLLTVFGASVALVQSGIFASAAESEPLSLEDVVEVAQESAPAEQEEALADGVVTWEEHEAAILRTAECLSARGVNVEVRTARGRMPSAVGFAVASLEEGESARAELENCRQLHLNEIDKVWLRSVLPEDVERVANEYLSACLLVRGWNIPSQAPDGSVVNVFSAARDADASEAAFECLEQRRIERGY